MSEKTSESQTRTAEDARPTQSLYDEVNEIRGQQPTVSAPDQSREHRTVGQAIQQDWLTIDDSIYEARQSEARVSNAVFDIREATGKNYLLGWGTDESLLNETLIRLSPTERKQADEMYLKRNGVTLRAEINDEESCSQRALSLALLEWPNGNGKNAKEFWENFTAFGSSNRIITSLAAMTREEIQVLDRAHRDSYGEYPLFDHLSGDKDHLLERALPLLEKGKDKRNHFESRSLLALLANDQRFDTLLEVAKHAPESDRRWLASLPEFNKMLQDEMGELEAKKFLETLEK